MSRLLLLDCQAMLLMTFNFYGSRTKIKHHAGFLLALSPEPPKQVGWQEDLGVKPEVNLAGEFSAKVWAEEFNKTLVKLGHQPFDPGFLIAWFANAIMAGYDHANWERPARNAMVDRMADEEKIAEAIFYSLRPNQNEPWEKVKGTDVANYCISIAKAIANHIREEANGKIHP